MRYELRDYQEKALTLMRQEFSKNNKKIVLFLATGAGKGLIMSQVAYNLLQNNKKVITIMRRREVVFQTIKNYKKYHNINASPIMSGSKGFDPKNPCQICSIDTIRARVKKGDVEFLKEFDFVIVDECHDTNSPTYQDFFKFLGDKLYCGFSATPFVIGKKPLKFWDVSVKPIEPRDLRDQGFLCATKTFAPFVIDTSKVGVKAGEFDQEDLFKKVTENAVIGDIVQTYIKYGENRPAILFAMNKAHSAMMSEAFRQSGIPSIHQDESHSSKERAIAIGDLVSGKIKVLCNVNIFSTGVDIPEAIVGIMARPTMSEILWVQQLGRLLRPSPGKTHAIILDHAGNTHRHGGAFIVRHSGLLSEMEKKKEENKIETVTCPHCFAVLEDNSFKCPECGGIIKTPEEREAVDRSSAPQKDGVLLEINENEDPIVEKHRELKKLQKERGYKPMWLWFQLHNQFQDEIYIKLIVPSWARKILNDRATTRF